MTTQLSQRTVVIINSDIPVGIFREPNQSLNSERRQDCESANTQKIHRDRLVQAVGEITDNATKAVVVCCVIFLIAHVSVHISIWGELTNWGVY